MRTKFGWEGERWKGDDGSEDHQDIFVELGAYIDYHLTLQRSPDPYSMSASERMSRQHLIKQFPPSHSCDRFRWTIVSNVRFF